MMIENLWSAALAATLLCLLGCKESDCIDPSDCIDDDVDTGDGPPASSQGCVLPPSIPDFIELPRETVDTSLPVQMGAEITVQAGESIQAAIDSANPGDTIILEAGASWTEEVHLPDKGDNDAWIIIQSSELAQLPLEGVRVTPEHAHLMPEILAPSGNERAVIANQRANHYRFIGISFGIAATENVSLGIIDLGRTKHNGDWIPIADRPHHIVFDRSLVRGIPEPTETGNEGTKYGILFSGAHLAVINSTIHDIKKVGQDNQAIIGTSGSGPYKIINNRLEAAGENILFGGGDTPDGDHNAKDIEICGNHILKPMDWFDPEFKYRARWSLKNLVEFKHGQRVVFTGNILENNWASAQTGWSILLRSTDQGGGENNSHQKTDNVIIAYNQILNITNGIDANGRGSGSSNAGPTENLYIAHNLFDRMGRESDFGGTGWLFILSKDLRNVVISKNTAFNSQTYLLTNCTGHGQSCSDRWANAILNLQVQDNIMNYGEPGYGIHGSGGATDEEQFSNATDEASMLINNVITGGPGKQYPSDTNYLPEDLDAVGFVNWAGGDYQLSESSPYLTAATDGGPVGADITALLEATAGVRAGE